MYSSRRRRPTATTLIRTGDSSGMGRARRRLPADGPAGLRPSFSNHVGLLRPTRRSGKVEGIRSPLPPPGWMAYDGAPVRGRFRICRSACSLLNTESPPSISQALRCLRTPDFRSSPRFDAQVYRGGGDSGPPCSRARALARAQVLALRPDREHRRITMVIKPGDHYGTAKIEPRNGFKDGCRSMFAACRPA